MIAAADPVGQAHFTTPAAWSGGRGSAWLTRWASFCGDVTPRREPRQALLILTHRLEQTSITIDLVLLEQS